MTLNETAPSPHETLVQADTLALLFRQSFPALFYSMGVCCLLCWTVWGGVPSSVLLTWMGALAIGNLIRLTVFLSYFRSKPLGVDVLRWQWPYVATLILSGAIWGLGGLALFVHATDVGKLTVQVFIVGMTAGGVVTYSGHRGTTLISTLTLMGPSVVWLYMQPDRGSLGVALAGSAFMLNAVRGTKVLSEAMQQQIQIGYQLNQANETAQKLARVDELTGLNNRRAFMDLGDGLARLCRRTQAPVSCALIDIDLFKKINDTHGHGAGDCVLQHVATLLLREFRTSDVCGRLGGEEFAVVLPDTDMAGATAVAERFRSAIAQHCAQWHEHSIQVTVSIGIASQRTGLTELLHDADMAMYAAKAAGRNRVVCHSTGVEETV